MAAAVGTKLERPLRRGEAGIGEVDAEDGPRCRRGRRGIAKRQQASARTKSLHRARSLQRQGLRGVDVADGDGQRVGGVGRLGQFRQAPAAAPP